MKRKHSGGAGSHSSSGVPRGLSGYLVVTEARTTSEKVNEAKTASLSKLKLRNQEPKIKPNSAA